MLIRIPIAPARSVRNAARIGAGSPVEGDASTACSVVVAPEVLASGAAFSVVSLWVVPASVAVVFSVELSVSVEVSEEAASVWSSSEEASSVVDGLFS
jgi:hypothetical protein